MGVSVTRVRVGIEGGDGAGEGAALVKPSATAKSTYYLPGTYLELTFRAQKKSGAKNKRTKSREILRTCIYSGMRINDLVFGSRSIYLCLFYGRAWM